MQGENTLGTFRIARKLGEGGFSAVYEAYDYEMQRTVALKLVHPHMVFTYRGQQRFMREIEAARRLRYRHIVPVYRAGFIKERGFISMQLMDRGTVADLLHRKELPDEVLVAQIIRHTARGLDYARKYGILHRDIKPSNIFLQSNGIVCLGDFGIAKVRGFATITRSADIVGTVFYMSPEQVKGLRNMTHLSDVYSLGVVLFELVTGRLPFEKEHKAALLHEITHAAPPNPRSISPHVGRHVARVILKALAKEPGQRFHSASELAYAYQEAISRDRQRIYSPRPTGSRSQNKQNPQNIPNSRPRATEQPAFWILMLGLLGLLLLLLSIYT